MRFFIFSAMVVLILFALPSVCFSDTEASLQQNQAIKRIDRYIEHFRKTGDRQTLLKELQQAEIELKNSFEMFKKAGNLAGGALSLIRLGDIQRLQNRWKEAKDYYEKAENLAKKANHSAHHAKALTGLARVESLGLRDYGAAIIHIEQAVKLSSLVEDKTYLFDALDLKSQIQISRGELIAAADTLNRAFSASAGLNDQTLLFYGYLDRADIYLKLAEKCDYQRVFEPCYEALKHAKADYTQALIIARRLGYDGLAKYTEWFLQETEKRGELIKSQEGSYKQLTKAGGIFHPKKPDDVLAHQEFLTGSQNIPAGILELVQQEGGFAGAGDSRSFYIQGLLHEMQGESKPALASYLKAIELLEGDRRRLRDEKGRGAFLEDKIGFYYNPILHLLQGGRFSEAFDLLERSRSRAMADLLAGKQLGLSGQKDRVLYAESLKLQTDIALLQKGLFNYRSRPDRDKFAEKISKAEKEIQRLEGDYQRLLNRIVSDSPRLQELILSKPASLEMLQRSMKQDRYDVLQYLVLEHGIILWHISSDAVHVKSVFLPRSELIAKVAALKKGLSDRKARFDEQTVREMFLFLIQPAMKWIKTGHLVIIPHEDLNYIPFQVFQDPSNNKFAGELFQISYAPSVSILLNLKKGGGISGKKLLAAADPDITEAADEVKAIGRLYAGRSKVVNESLIKETDVKAWAGDYNLLHLSVHGKFNPQEPLLSNIKLKGGGKDDGLLTAAEMFGLPLDKTLLVVLSACETGQAEATHANEILGMVRALLYAGANTLILSYWEVEAASTALWMETFYREAQTKPLSEAAHSALMAVKKHPSYNHPYYWGAFMMVGR